jgi:CRP-like cAMP-binding protein
LAKWLLSVRDRMDSDTLGLTHDFLSHMLGIRRSGVTVAVGALTLDGLVRHERSSITIIDRDGLEARTCECYRIVREA